MTTCSLQVHGDLCLAQEAYQFFRRCMTTCSLQVHDDMFFTGAWRPVPGSRGLPVL
jgi:hypothetical protein